MFADVFVG